VPPRNTVGLRDHKLDKSRSPRDGTILGVVWPTEKHVNHDYGVSGRKKKINNCDSGTAAVGGKAPAWPVPH